LIPLLLNKEKAGMRFFSPLLNKERARVR